MFLNRCKLKFTFLPLIADGLFGILLQKGKLRVGNKFDFPSVLNFYLKGNY